MDQQIALIQEAFGRARGARLGGAPLDISVSRQFGEATVTLRTQLGGGGGPPALSSGTKRDSTGADVAGRQPSLDERMSGSTEDGGAVPAAPPLRNRNVSFWSDGSAGGGGDAAMAEDSVAGIVRRTSTGGFYEDPSEVVRLTAEIERLKRKALSRGVNLTSKDEQVPAEDVAMLKQIFGLADSTGDGFIDEEELIAMHQVLGEPLTPSEATSAFKAMDMNESGNISFDDFLSWYTLAHSRSGMLSKKGQAYTARFKKIMNKIEGSFDLKHLTTTTTGKPKSLDYRVQFHYNVKGQLKQISPWHDIPLYSPEGHCHLIVEIPKFSRAKFEIATGEEYNPIKQDVKNGKLRNYNYGDMLFNYGAFPQTWEDPAHVTPDTGHGGDNDPIDAVEIGTKMFRTGSVVKVKVLGCLAMIDDGATTRRPSRVTSARPATYTTRERHTLTRPPRLLRRPQARPTGSAW